VSKNSESQPTNNSAGKHNQTSGVEHHAGEQSSGAAQPSAGTLDVERRWVHVTMADATTTAVRIFSPQGETEEPRKVELGTAESVTVGSRIVGDSGVEGDQAESRPLIVLWPGFGMGARYYEPIARELASRGWTIAIGELHGQGESTAVATRKANWGYHDMASEDFPRTIRAVKQKLGLAMDYPTVMLTHSMGGQMGALFLARPEAKELNVKGLMGVGTGTPYYKGVEGRTRVELRFGSLLMRAIAKVVGYQPSGILDVAGYGRQARDHVVEWTHYAQTNQLKSINRADMDYIAAMKGTNTNILLTRFVNDGDCPLASEENLALAFPQGVVQVEEYPRELGELGHNRWAREPNTVSDRFEPWVAELD